MMKLVHTTCWKRMKFRTSNLCNFGYLKICYDTIVAVVVYSLAVFENIHSHTDTHTHTHTQ